jgi:hypothetical protein
VADRASLIARKHAVRGEIERTQRELARLRSPDSVNPNQRRIRQLEKKLEQLMAEEYRLRVAIDRAR